MSKVLFDTNVLLDIAVPSRPGSDDALALLGRADEGLDSGVVCAGSLKDFYYVMQKYSTEAIARGLVRLFMEMLEVAPVDLAICRSAIDGNEPDFEDGIIRAAAEDLKADFIITRDESAFLRSRIKSVSPSLYLEIAGYPQQGYAVADL